MASSNGNMNFLAHLYLSGPQPETIFGNFIGDGVKGNAAGLYPADVQKGIALHRFIDTYTDTHPVTAEARKIIRPQFRKYSGVVLDVYFDHFLGVNWHEYHPQKLENFVEKVESILGDFEPNMPAKTQRFYHYMKSYQWLLNYRKFETLSEVFQGMASRTPFVSNMENAVIVLKEHYPELEERFTTFFPDLIAASENFLQDQ